ncbi:MAG: phage holin family protein [Candidatus Melainabacteria bacterium]|nr:phage holin family protein [Candidatus Melainabacteria bacterium]
MYQFLARVLINGFLLAFLLPALLPSISFHGAFWPEGVIAGCLFALVVVVVEFLLGAFGILTLGIGFVLRYLLWFVVPALQLLAMAHWFPQYLTIGSFSAALLGGFVLMIVNAFTNSTPTGRTTG